MSDEPVVDPARLAEVLRQLTPLERSVYRAVTLDGYELEAVARAHEIPVARARRIVLAVRRSLRSALEGR